MQASQTGSEHGITSGIAIYMCRLAAVVKPCRNDLFQVGFFASTDLVNLVFVNHTFTVEFDQDATAYFKSYQLACRPRYGVCLSGN